MQIITPQTRIDNVAKRWREQYSYGNDSIGNPMWRVMPFDVKTKYEKLRCLPNNATEQDVADIIGNRSWTDIRCNCCLKTAKYLVLVHEGADEDHDDPDFCMCEYCIEKANRLSILNRKPYIPEKVQR